MKMKPLALSAALFALAAAASASCGSDGDSGSKDAAAAVDARVRPRDTAASSASDSCLRCSMIAGFLSGDGPAGGPAAMDPCAGGGMPPGGAGGGGFSFCNETVFTAFTGCMQDKCAASCPLGGGPMGMGMMGGTGSPPDGGMCTDAGAPAVGGPDAGGESCGTCLRARCASELGSCEADR